MIQTVSISFFRFPSAAARLWVLGQMGAARLDFRRMREAGFFKLCGSGKGEGFLPVPNTAVWAILATWPDADTARDRVNAAPVYRRWRSHASESWTVYLSATSARGAWSGVTPFEVGDAPTDGPIAALTRATVRPKAIAGFWGRVPQIDVVIGADPNVLFKIGIGELPWLHQVTFSIWPDLKTMHDFARADGPHALAIRAVREHGWFREELYARFTVLGHEGLWNGKAPLQGSERIAA
ncbi:spheroidene monooxygenase [Ovoidimarina sediminis]|uniref:spheroidene monooxygenase n=1 Tax=Ovoidimarina sediminis TaxID=3079856 RepID=UPI0029127BDA|nr:spheroidene monooxygenase [Rhodophyticola sp. MJ-SS7]MDU8942436.1 spheroidene monooxygenase [Rhodophyticola sp. MJ-SS7]